MAKKLFILAVVLGALFFSTQQMSAQNGMHILDVQLQVRYLDPTPSQVGRPRGPEDPLTIGLEDHTLYMSNVNFDVTLQLTDANDNVVYTTFVAANTSMVVLPSTLTGEYKIVLIDDERCFWGYIEL